jgi:SOS-response transcriptional repressor LexA
MTHNPPFDPELLARIGEALYGPLWINDLGRALGISPRLFRKYADGIVNPPPNMAHNLLSFCQRREDKLSLETANLRASIRRREKTRHPVDAQIGQFR